MYRLVTHPAKKGCREEKKKEERRKWKKEEEDLKFYQERRWVGRSAEQQFVVTWAVGILHIPRMCRLSQCALANIGWRRDRRTRVRALPCTCNTNTKPRGEHEYREREWTMSHTVRFVCWHRGRKRSGCLALAFRHNAHAFSPRRPNRVPNVEQRRHTNPHGYPGRRAGEWFFPSLFAVSSSCPPYFLHACFFLSYITWIKRHRRRNHIIFLEVRLYSD